MNEINEEAYMNGYNWDAFFNYYLEENAPDILESMESDPEAGSYAAYFEDTAENEQKAKRFADIIIPQGGENAKGIGIICDYIQGIVER